MQDITTLVPGDLLKVPVEAQANKRPRIIDNRFPDCDWTVTLLGKRGGQYHLKQTKEIVHLNHYTHRRNDWVGAETFAVDRIAVDPDVEVEL